MNLNKEISLTELFQIIRLKLKWIIAVALLATVISTVYSALFVTKKYTSSAKMIASFTTLQQGVDETPNSISTTQIEAGAELTTTFAEILKSDYTAQKIYDEIAPHWSNVSASLVKQSISISQINSTALMKINITTSNAELSKDICNAFVRIAPDVISEKFWGKLSVLDYGTLPASSSYPNIPRNAIIGFAIGVAASLAVIFAMHLFDNRIDSVEALEGRFSIPVLGSIPSFNQKKNKSASTSADSSDVAKGQGSFFVIEAYKNVRTNLLYTINSKIGENVIAISGADAGVGKSVTCANLAIAFAQSKKRVLIIDADMRKPTQYRLFKKQNTDGLSRVLSGQSAFSQAVFREVAPGLDLLTSGPIPPNPSELMSSETMEKLIKAVSNEYDCVFIDTPPINYVTDCLTIANKISGVALIARQGYTEYNELTKAIESLNTIGSKPLGIILSDVRRENNDKYYSKKYYRSYYVKNGTQNLAKK